MKLRKLVMCALVGIMLVGFTGVNTYAEEITNTTVTTTTPASTTDAASTTVTNAADATTTPAVEATIEETTEATNKEDSTIEDSKEATDSVKDTTTETKKETPAKTTTKKSTAKKYSQADLRLLSCLIFAEAGGESYNGKLAVGIVVMNRKASSAFPNSVKGVIYQKYQFGPVRNGSLSAALRQYDAGKFTSSAEKACIKAAKAALSGTKTITVNGKKKSFGKYLYFSGSLRNATYRLGNHEFK